MIYGVLHAGSGKTNLRSCLAGVFLQMAMTMEPVSKLRVNRVGSAGAAGGAAKWLVHTINCLCPPFRRGECRASAPTPWAAGYFGVTYYLDSVSWDKILLRGSQTFVGGIKLEDPGILLPSGAEELPKDPAELAMMKFFRPAASIRGRCK